MQPVKNSPFADGLKVRIFSHWDRNEELWKLYKTNSEVHLILWSLLLDWQLWHCCEVVWLDNTTGFQIETAIFLIKSEATVISIYYQSTSPMRINWEKWDCLSWRSECSRETLLQPFNICRRIIKKNEDKLFSSTYCHRTRGNGFEPKEVWFRSAVRKKLFTRRVVKCWTRLPSDVVGALSPETLKIRSNRALSNLI